jgi:starch phosphorylase
MRALRSFTVRAKLPAELAPLHELAMNLRWSWDERMRDLFRWVDPDQWEVTGHDPVRLLGLVPKERLDALAADASFMSFLGDVHSDLKRYLEAPRWFQNQSTPSALKAVAYFSPEFGIAEALPQYSGGLGVLAGDHLKAASDLGVPLVGVGLFYREGYFRQELNGDGWQTERFPTLDPHAMALTLVEGARVEVDLGGTPLFAQIWRADVGRIRLYLLDSDIDDNDEEGRQVTDRLYGGDPQEHRIRQEILLGIGGVRALDAVGETTQVFHTNEGHAGFLGLERIRRLMTGDGLSFAEAVEAVRAGTIFTTHTPVPAGIDRFKRDVMERYFKSWAAECGVAFDELMALGHFPGEEADSPFNMAVMGLRLAGMANGVSKLHGGVSREMFQPLWPDVSAEETPISAFTNGVHGQMGRSRLVGLGASHGRSRRRGVASPRAGPRAAGGLRPQAPPRIAARPGRQRERRHVVRRGPRPAHPHHRVQPTVRHLQATDAAPEPARPPEGASALGRPAHPARVRRQGPSG